ncbi:hypothetical protein [Nonomuraea sp. SBT364]|nr:hypothetical protein [Nonomuraea sp. SBT364]
MALWATSHLTFGLPRRRHRLTAAKALALRARVTGQPAFAL